MDQMQRLLPGGDGGKRTRALGVRIKHSHQHIMMVLPGTGPRYVTCTYMRERRNLERATKGTTMKGLQWVDWMVMKDCTCSVIWRANKEKRRPHESLLCQRNGKNKAIKFNIKYMFLKHQLLLHSNNKFFFFFFLRDTWHYGYSPLDLPSIS